MKKSALIIILSILFSISSFASYRGGNSVLELSLWNNSKFSVIIDHQEYPSSVRQFRIENLRPGNHFIKVIKKTQRRNGFISQVIYRGTIRIEARSITTAKISRHRVLNIIRVKPIRIRSNHGHNSHHGRRSQGVNGRVNTGVNSHSSSSSYIYQDVMSDYSFNMLKSTIISRSFDSKRLEVAKLAIIENMFRSSQILELMELLSFESNRLELAKFAYTQTIDTENYFIVQEAFAYSSSISDLHHYINTIPA